MRYFIVGYSPMEVVRVYAPGWVSDVYCLDVGWKRMMRPFPFKGGRRQEIPELRALLLIGINFFEEI